MTQIELQVDYVGSNSLVGALMEQTILKGKDIRDLPESIIIKVQLTLRDIDLLEEVDKLKKIYRDYGKNIPRIKLFVG